MTGQESFFCIVYSQGIEPGGESYSLRSPCAQGASSCCRLSDGRQTLPLAFCSHALFSAVCSYAIQPPEASHRLFGFPASPPRGGSVRGHCSASKRQTRSDELARIGLITSLGVFRICVRIFRLPLSGRGLFTLRLRFFPWRRRAGSQTVSSAVFSITLTTTSFACSCLWRFGASACTAAPRDPSLISEQAWL